MRNKLKIAAIVVAVIVGIVLYKESFDRKHGDEGDDEDKVRSKAKKIANKNQWN